MNEKNLTETQLSSWLPRRPSAAIKRRIFAPTRQTSHNLRWFWGALTPLTACCLMTLIIINSGTSSLQRKPEISLVLGSLGAANFASQPVLDGFETPENHLSSVTFDMTNHTYLNSSMGFSPTTNLSH